MIKTLKKIEIKRKYVYLTHYGGLKPIVKIPKNKVNLFISVDLPKQEKIRELGK